MNFEFDPTRKAHAQDPVHGGKQSGMIEGCVSILL